MCFSEAVSFSGSARAGGGCSRDEAWSSWTGGLVVLGGEKGRPRSSKQIMGEEFKVRRTKEPSDIKGFCKT